MILAKDLEYVKENGGLLMNIDEVARMLHGLVNSIKKA